MFRCDQCQKDYLRKDSLARHNRIVHDIASSEKRKYVDQDEEEDSYPPLQRSNAVPDNWKPNEDETGFAG